MYVMSDWPEFSFNRQTDGQMDRCPLVAVKVEVDVLL